MFGAGATACVVTLATTPVVLVGMRRLAAVDRVNERSSHQVPTPRGGGVATVLGVFAGVAVLVVSSGHGDAPTLLPLTVAICLFGLLGLAEDLGPIPPLRRLALQGLAALATTAVALATAWLAGPGDTPAGLVIAAVALGPLWLTAFVNAFNFMDGINGISAAQAIVAGAAYAVLGSLSDLPGVTAGGAVVAGAALGFAPFNVRHARIFLGDVGSYALGASLGVLTLAAVLGGVAPEAAIAPLLLYLADTGSTLLRRIRSGETWYLPHRMHVYQRLIDAGWSHTRVAGLVAAYIAAMSALGVAADHTGLATRTAVGLTVCALAASYLMTPSLVRPARPTGPPGRHRRAAVAAERR